jgi:HK97 family phage portal protein
MGPVSIGGRVVSAQTALGVSTALACGRAIAEGVATPELHVYREKSDGRRELARNIPEYRMINRRPNEWQTSFEFRRMMTLHYVFTGNALAVKTMAGNRVRELIPVKPGMFQVEYNARYDVRYRVYDEFGLIGVFGPRDVLHLHNLEWDFVKGMDVNRLAASALGLSMAAEENQAKLHENGGRPAGILTTDQAVTPEAIDKLKQQFKAFSAERRNGTAVLDKNWKYIAMAMTGVDGQHLETRKFQVEEICRAYGVFPSIIGHSDKAATYASAESFFGAHRIQTMMPHWRMWQQRLDEYVLDGQGPLFAEFDTRYTVGGSLKDQAVYARTMAEMGILTRNELRDDLGRDPLPGLDEPLTPLNMTGGKAPAEEGKENDEVPAGAA